MDRRNLLIGAGLAALVASGGMAFAQQPVVKLGYQLPLTGNTAQYGQDFKNAAEIALAKFNSSGKPFKVEIIFEDSRSDAKEGIAIARKFVDNKEIVGVLGDFTSGVSMASAQVYKSAGMPQLSQTASHPDYAKISEWQFRNITTQAQEGPYNANWMLERGFKKIAVIAEQTDWGQTVVSNFADEVKAKGGEIVFSEFFNRGLADFRPIITKIAREKPDAIYTGFFYEDGAQFLKQMKQLGVDIPVYSTSAAYNQKLIELAGADAEGMHLTATFLPSNPAPHVQEFVAAWKEKTGQAEPGQFPAQAYDAVNIMLAAVEKAWPEPTRQKVRDALAATKDFPGVTGDTTFDANREPAKKLTKAVVKNGQFVAVTD
ncbi:ABC transporter substrate-binding protein [Chelatococcus composti]|jgi:ABC-type branched-chain amino acid transport systems, periplasmic component|uniref:Branched-chain amino acid transport system substrate-binding protein n=1 Tax=Chelatococcus composti TaxID=1743235 RepID=A0A841K797_9HYPH|nr:ABC transporter substrate-binding protein [Chelatococcus composti]MBB6167950.1 branched-chain amino acid transport system substrate-binding protein [Chelatococcus composti]GGG34680.1 amino acid ABC transporter substrate-binding protein [Chelatococcus composti]